MGHPQLVSRRRAVVAALCALLLLLAPPASAQGDAFVFTVPGDGVVTVVGTIRNVAYWDGVFVLEGPNNNPTPSCRTGGTTFVCRVTAGPATTGSVGYTLLPPRCGLRPRLTLRVDEGPPVVIEGPPPLVECVYVPQVAQ